jgi:hypothetical protein
MLRGSAVKSFLHKALATILFAGLMFGLFVIVFIPFEMYKKSQAESWPSRSGVVTLSTATRHSGSAGRTGAAPYYTADVCGIYEDNGEKFCVDRIRYGGFRFGAGKDAARDTAARYPVGSKVDVYHDPDDPRTTVLEASSPWTEMLVLLGLAIGFLLVPLFLWLLRKIAPRREPE